MMLLIRASSPSIDRFGREVQSFSGPAVEQRQRCPMREDPRAQIEELVVCVLLRCGEEPMCRLPVAAQHCGSTASHQRTGELVGIAQPCGQFGSFGVRR